METTARPFISNRIYGKRILKENLKTTLKMVKSFENEERKTLGEKCVLEVLSGVEFVRAVI